MQLRDNVAQPLILKIGQPGTEQGDCSRPRSWLAAGVRIQDSRI